MNFSTVIFLLISFDFPAQLEISLFLIQLERNNKGMFFFVKEIPRLIMWHDLNWNQEANEKKKTFELFLSWVNFFFCSFSFSFPILRHCVVPIFHNKKLWHLKLKTRKKFQLSSLSETFRLLRKMWKLLFIDWNSDTVSLASHQKSFSG